MHDLFVFEQSGVDSEGHATGRFVATGIRPKVAERIEARGLMLPADLFARLGEHANADADRHTFAWLSQFSRQGVLK